MFTTDKATWDLVAGTVWLDRVLGDALLVLVILCLLGIGIFARYFAASSDAIRAYQDAPTCSSPEPSCRAVVTATVLATHHFGRQPGTDRVQLALPDGQRVEVTRFDDGGLFRELRPGDTIQATIWQGKVAALRGQDGRMLLTTNSPQASRAQWFSLGAASLSLAIALFLGAWHFLRRASAFDRARRDPHPLLSYSLPITLTDAPSPTLATILLILLFAFYLPLFILLGSALDPFAHPLSGPSDADVFVGLLTLLFVGLIVGARVFHVSTWSVQIAPWGLRIAGTGEGGEIPFADLARVAFRWNYPVQQVYPDYAAYPTSRFGHPQPPVSPVLALTLRSGRTIYLPLVFSHHDDAVLVDALERYAPAAEIDPRARFLRAGVGPPM